MFLKDLQILQFKNIDEAKITLSPKVNCFLGNNGAGKTTVLDALYYLSFCKSFFNPIDSQNIKHDQDFFMLDANFENNEEEIRVYCGLKRGEKKRFKKNQKEYERLADHIGTIPLVMIAPADTHLIREGSDKRRKLMDGIIAQYNRGYLETLLQYNRTLAQRNAMLKHFWAEGRKLDATAFEVFDEQLHAFGTDIHNERKRFLEGYLPIFSSFYKNISANAEQVSLQYESYLHEKPLSEWLNMTRQNDLRAQFTTKGIHKDDLHFMIGDHPLKKFGSQGQQKSFVIAMRLAQFDYLKDLKSKKPILLLDDIFDKLDDHRVAALMEMVADDHFGQIFITDANLHRVPELFENQKVPIKKFEVSSGQIKEVDNG